MAARTVDVGGAGVLHGGAIEPDANFPPRRSAGDKAQLSCAGVGDVVAQGSSSQRSPKASLVQGVRSRRVFGRRRTWLQSMVQAIRESVPETRALASIKA